MNGARSGVSEYLGGAAAAAGPGPACLGGPDDGVKKQGATVSAGGPGLWRSISARHSRITVFDSVGEFIYAVFRTGMEGVWVDALRVLATEACRVDKAVDVWRGRLTSPIAQPRANQGVECLAFYED
ncbi:hypothetical protein LSTR_LSTR014833 [Laodelphax striatellus]|uniref:Uncharacterized protein n=1 Tax=Laodelphax striatellus TaxID=195883 RepID=A0A482WMM1_LAOST|nr:hypothetical protein LSTR_LSTR014833 [Laodelphax striatellus]